MIFLLLLLCLSLLAICCIYYCSIYFGRVGRLINLIPGQKGLPVLGHIAKYMGSTEHLWKIEQEINSKYYPIYKFWMLHFPVIVIFHPNDLETMLNNIRHIEKGPIYDALHPWFGTGLLTSGGAKWNTRRRLLTPAFHFNILQQFMEVLIEESQCMTQTLKNIKEPVIKDLIPFISVHTLNVICETAMGISLGSMTTFQQKYREAVYEMNERMIIRLFRPWLYYEIIYKFSWNHIRQYKLLKILKGFTKKVIEEKKRTFKQKKDLKSSANDIDDNESNIYKKKQLAMLDLLLKASHEGLIDDAGIEEEVDTFMFEGHDTIAMGMCFALAAIAEHKDIQVFITRVRADRIRNEIDAALKENDNKFTMSLLQNLPFLERVLKESLRLYPSVPTISRETAEDVQLASYTVPRGTIVKMHIYNVHRDPNFWPNPEVFDPDRFLPENSRNRHPFSYIPFSAGPRNCIGQRFAMLELKAMTASLLHSFYLEPVDSLKCVQHKMDLVLRPAHKLRVKFIPIK